MPKEAYGIVGLFAGVIAAIFLATYSGPYRWAADVQLHFFHENLVALSFLFAFALCATPLFFAVYGLEKRYGERETWFTPIWNDFDRVLDLWPGKLLLVGATLTAMGVFFGLKDLAMGGLRKLSVRDAMPDSAYVELVDGTVDESHVLRFRSNSTRYRYVPVFGESTSQPVLFLRSEEHHSLRDAEGKIVGIVEKDAMEGELVSRLEGTGLVGEHVWVLGVGRRPTPKFGMGTAAVGFLLMLGGLFGWKRALRA